MHPTSHRLHRGATPVFLHASPTCKLRLPHHKPTGCAECAFEELDRQSGEGSRQYARFIVFNDLACSLARRATAAVAVAAAAGRPGRCGRQEREGSETQMIVNMMIVLELECLVSRQWQEQIRGFQPGQPAGCSWKTISGCRNIQEYQGI